MRILVAELVLLQCARCLPVLPEHLSHGELGTQLLVQAGASARRGRPGHLAVPLDHFGSGGETWELKYYVDDTAFRPGGALVLNMPNEGPTDACPASSLARHLAAVAVCAEHRFFGGSVPRNSSTQENLQYLSVEQNLADQAALVRHIRSLYPGVSRVVANGGSYSGASAAWMRHAYPGVVDAAIAASPPVTVRMGFPEYDTSNLVALASPDYRCAQAMARTSEALERQMATNRTALMRLFNAEYDIMSDLGDTDFMYGLADSAASAVQYGSKETLCQALRPLHGGDASDARHAEVFANYTLSKFGAGFFSGCFYNSTCMRESARRVPAESARSWYWLKCTQLGYFQVSPPTGLAARPRKFTLAAAVAQCRYIFPEAKLISEESVAAFNAKFGGGALGGTPNIFELDFSDDPWKMASSHALVARRDWPLTLQQPFLYLTCDGCAHCGSGVPAAVAQSIEEQTLAALRSWGIAGVDAGSAVARARPPRGPALVV